jgi:hypothetical protein
MHIMSSAAVVDSADRMPGLNINVGNVATNTSTNSREVDWSSNGPSSFLLGQLPRNDKVPIACRRGISMQILSIRTIHLPRGGESPTLALPHASIFRRISQTRERAMRQLAAFTRGIAKMPELPIVVSDAFLR